MGSPPGEVAVVWLGGLLLSGVVSAAPAEPPAEPPAAYTRAVDLVQELYFDLEHVTPQEMLRSAATELSDQVDWLLSEPTRDGVLLRHGVTGRVLAEVNAYTYAQLPGALYQLEQTVRAAGTPWGDADLRWTTIDGATDALDRYSRVLVGDGLDRFDTRLKGTLVGIGARLRIEQDQLRIVDVFDDGPADRAGVRGGDWIVRIDERSTVNMPVAEAQRRLKGDEGTVVVLELRRGSGEAAKAVRAEIARSRIILPNVVHRVLEAGVGYVRIDNVSQKTVYNLRRAMSDLLERDALGRGLVLDLRGNTGGSMKESAGVVDQFVEEGLLLATVGRDGLPVRNLLARIDARDANDEPPIPLIVLVDERTASGAEIIAGGLTEHERAVVLGQRTYGKGKVQKVYDLADDARMKLTVAEYVLANDRRVTTGGLPPDVTFGEIVLDGDGMRLGPGFDLERERIAWSDVVPLLDERPGWRGRNRDPGDAILEVARRAILASASPSRADVLAAVQRTVASLRVEETARLADAMASQGIDWSASPGRGAAPETRVSLSVAPDPRGPDRLVVSASVINQGPTTLHRTLLRLRSPTLSAWNEVVIPVGRIPSGGTGAGTATLSLRPGLQPREDLVGVQVIADQRPPQVIPDARLVARSSELPELRVSARLDGAGVDRVAVITVANLSDVALTGLEAEFAYPSDLDLELLDHASRRPSLEPKGSITFELGVRMGATAPPAEMPLRLRLQADGYGRLLAWEVPLRADGRSVALQAPRARAELHALVFEPGTVTVPITVTDDRRVAAAEVFVGTRKVAYARGSDVLLALVATVPIEPGQNYLTVRAVDDQGIHTRTTWALLGLGNLGEGISATSDGPDDEDSAESVSFED